MRTGLAATGGQCRGQGCPAVRDRSPPRLEPTCPVRAPAWGLPCEPVSGAGQRRNESSAVAPAHRGFAAPLCLGPRSLPWLPPEKQPRGRAQSREAAEGGARDSPGPAPAGRAPQRAWTHPRAGREQVLGPELGVPRGSVAPGHRLLSSRCGHPPAPTPAGAGRIWTPSLERCTGSRWVDFSLCCWAVSARATDEGTKTCTVYGSHLKRNPFPLRANIGSRQTRCQPLGRQGGKSVLLLEALLRSGGCGPGPAGAPSGEERGRGVSLCDCHGV